MKIGEIRFLIKNVSIKYGEEKDLKKQLDIEKTIAEIISYIKEKLGDFASVADDLVVVDSKKIEELCKILEKYLQE